MQLTEDDIQALGKTFVEDLLADWQKDAAALAVDDQGNPIPDVISLEPATTLISVGNDGGSTDFSPSKPNQENRDVNRAEKIHVIADWGTLRWVIVGRADNDVLAAWYPSFTDPDGNEVAGPETAGMTKEEFNPAKYKLSIEQKDKLCDILEREGVKVFRPPLVSKEIAQSDPIGLAASWARELITVIGNKIIVNQQRAAHRNKEHQVIEPFLQALEQKGLAEILRLPYCSLERNDNWEADSRPFLEGGDIFRLGKSVIVTMSYLASSPAGFRWLADKLEPDIEVWPAYLTQEWEHGDYIFSPIREGLCIAHLAGFVDGLLPSPITDWDVIQITHEEANDKFAANGTMLRPDVLMLPAGNARVVRQLEKKGVSVLEIPYDGPIFWQGGIDCSMTELWRE